MTRHVQNKHQSAPDATTNITGTKSFHLGIIDAISENAAKITLERRIEAKFPPEDMSPWFAWGFTRSNRGVPSLLPGKVCGNTEFGCQTKAGPPSRKIRLRQIESLPLVKSALVRLFIRHSSIWHQDQPTAQSIAYDHGNPGF